MVYVISIMGKSLMPTSNAKARKLLNSGKAKVKKLTPFTIELTFKTKTEYTQNITLGIDSGYMNIGFSALTENKELIAGEVKLLQGMKERLSERLMYRRLRRQRLRYRKARWSNRKIKQGWLAPSLKHKLNTHIKIIDYLHSILPIKKIIIEIANFDIQYKSSGGSNAPSNLITLCTKCHTPENHKKGKFLYEWFQKNKKIKGFKDSAFMNIIRRRIIDELKEKYNNVEATYGYITKNHRITNGIEKTHCNDAFSIAKGIKQVRSEIIYTVEQSRLNNRSLEKFYDAKYIDIRTNEKVNASELNNGRRTRNKNLNNENLRIYRGKKIIKGQRRIRKGKSIYQPNDLIKYNGKIYTVKGSQNQGKYVALKEIKKVPNTKFISPYILRKGLNWSYKI